MGNPWYFGDVRYSEFSAETARDDLAGTAASLAEALRIVEQDIPVVVEDWAGEARMTFDAEMPGILEAGHRLLATLYAAVSAVAYHAEAAENEESLRRALRSAWYDDHPEVDPIEHQQGGT